jgi:signal peptidase I
MQKSKNATIIIILFILFYGAIATFKLVTNINVLYWYVINPIFWIALSIIMRAILGNNTENKKLKKPILEYTIVAILSFIIVNLLSGLIVTFGSNPYNTTLKGLLHNLWIFGVALVAKEYIRYKLINNVYDRDKTKIAILISIVYILIDLELNGLIGKTPLIVAKGILQKGLPSIAKNITFSYIAIHCSWVPSALYQILTNLYFWLTPILPNMPWVMKTIIETTIPTILLLYIRYVKNKLNIFRTKENIINSDPRNTIPLVVFIIIGIWFATGIFPIKPVAIATKSMMPEIYQGDIVIIKKCNANDVNVGDIIEYQTEDYNIIHRIIEKKQNNGNFIFTTKGDNNKQPDSDPVNENQLIGKVILRVKYLGYPAIWLNIIRASDQEMQIETGI